MATATKRQLSDDSEYAAAVDNLHRLQHRKLNLEATMTSSRNEARTAAKIDRVHLLLQGKTLADAPKPSVIDSEITAELSLLPVAIERAKEQVQLAASTASRPIAAAARAEYRERIRLMVKSLIALANAAHAAEQLTTDLDNRGVSWLGEFQPVACNQFGDPNDAFSLLWLKLREAVAEGYCSVSELAGWGAPIAACDQAKAMLKAAN